MNYSYLIPGSQTNVAQFVANSTGILGSYTKPLDARTQITVDYSQLVPAVTLLSYSFKIRPGGEPQLRIEGTQLTPALTPTALVLYVSGGIAGRAYQLVINFRLGSGEWRSDMLTINVLGDGCDTCAPLTPLPPGASVSGDGSIIVNTGPRFFVSGTPPVNPNVLDRWYNTATGDVYDYISNGTTTFWQLTVSADQTLNLGIQTIDPITPDGITATFFLTLQGVPVNVVGSDTLFVSIDGVWQQSEVQYVASTNIIVFTEAPSADAQVFMVWFSGGG